MSYSTHGLVLQNAGTSPLAAGIATFGQVFKPGEIPAGGTLHVRDGAQALPVQMDVKTRYEDGSVKMAVLAVQRPALAAGDSLDLVLTAGPTAPAAPSLDLAQGLSGHSFTVDLAIEDGATLRVDVLAELHAALQQGTASFWQQGALTTEARVTIDLPGSQRLVFDVAVFQGGGFAVEAQFNNDEAMQVVGGRARYDVTVTMDGTVMAQETLDQGQYQNWHKGFASNAHDGGQGIGSPAQGWLNIQHDIARLQDTGAVARYDLDQPVNASLLDSYGTAIQAPGWNDPLATNGVATYMPGTGGRADIGFTTQANTVWLMTQDARAAAYAMGQAEAASAVPWHFWDAANDTWLNTDAYPKLWLDGRGGTGQPGQANAKGLTQQVDGQTGWHTDTSHQPDLSYVPYLMTGERWMLDNLQAQGVWTILAFWPDPRGDGQDNVINGNQVRGAAWSLRQVDEAARVSPDGSPEKAFFQEASAANYAWLVSKIPEWTAQQGEAHGWVPGEYGTAGALPPWQQDYFASTVIAAARNGNADARTFLEWQANFLVGRFMAEDQGFEARDGAAYLIAISDPRNGQAYQSWAEIGAQTEARGWSNGDAGWAHSEGDYAQLALATLAGIHEITGSAAAKRAYELLIAENAPFAAAADFARDPTYAIAAPGKVPSDLPPIVAPPAELPSVVTPPVLIPPVPDAPVAEPGMVALAIVLGAESWQGDPIAVVQVDGQEVFRGSISAPLSQGGARYELGSFAAGEDHLITVAFLNDAWGGNAATDRNLHVQSILVDGVATGQARPFLINEEASFSLPAPVPPPIAVPRQDVLTIGISGDAWEGYAQYLITLDGEQIGSLRTANAAHAAGEVELVTLTGDFAQGPHQLGVTFLNDAWGGTAATDRNLHIESIAINGVVLSQHVALERTGTASFSFSARSATTSSPEAAAPLLDPGAAVLRLRIAQQAWQDEAEFIPFPGDADALRSTTSTQADTESRLYDMLRSVDGESSATDYARWLDHQSLNGLPPHSTPPVAMGGDVFM